MDVWHLDPAPRPSSLFMIGHAQVASSQQPWLADRVDRILVGKNVE